jgi:hypothetical protein
LSGSGDRQVFHFLSIEIHFATVWLMIASSNLDESGLASAVITYQSHDFIAGDGEVHWLQRLNFAKTLRDIPHFKYVVHQTISLRIVSLGRVAKVPGTSKKAACTNTEDNLESAFAVRSPLKVPGT